MAGTTRVRMYAAALLLVLAGLAGGAAQAAPCIGDAPTRVTGQRECLAVRMFRSAEISPAPALVVVVHGDINNSASAAATTHVPIAESLAADHRNLVVAALWRPGYHDGAGNASTGESHGHIDNYTAANVDEVAGAVAALKRRTNASRTIFVGFSGGGAFAALVIGRHPGLVDGAAVIACPCDLVAWRRNRNVRLWTRSESPSDYLARVPTTTRVVAIAGDRDTTTPAYLTRDYAERLAARGVPARAWIIPAGTHLSVFRRDIVSPVVGELLAAR
ncbi:MAG: prolyl oligopeptidase family serine peptidase [Alphaproteobacteria bacterium]|nr:prolyl oligopeptidase family serine peptidase [Alphaproteobacteria bacterium]